MRLQRYVVTGILFVISALGSTRAAENRKVEIDTAEGTWMSLDVSPDGRQIVFDLLGDIYMIPATGGDANRLTALPKALPSGTVDPELPNRGQAFDSQPRFSPDGKFIVFISDRDGADNVFVMRADGSGVRQLTTGRDTFISPAWSPDGRFIAVRRIEPDAGSGEGGSGLWLYRVEGGPGYKLDTAKFTSPSGLEFSPDGAVIYFASAIAAGPTTQLLRKERDTGKITQLTQNFGGAVRPRVSRNGKWLAYATFEDGETVLRIRDLASGVDRLFLRGIEQDGQLHSSGRLDLLPNYGFDPENRFVYLSYGGKLHRVAIADGKVEDVPFRVRTTLDVGPVNRTRVQPLEGQLRVRMLQFPHFRPDGKGIIFEALGRIWAADPTGQHAHRLTKSNEREYQPAISPDGKSVAYVTWSDSQRGAIRRVAIDGGEPVTLTQQPGFYVNPNWSPDGQMLVVAVGGGSDLQGQEATHDLTRTLSWISVGGGALHAITAISYAYVPTNNIHLHASVDIGGWFNHDGTRVWYMDGPSLHSVRLDGTDDRTHLKLAVTSPYDVEDPPIFIPSPDESRVVFTAGNNDVWLMPMPWTTAEPVVVNIKKKTTPGLKRISTAGGFFPSWIDNDDFSYTFAGKVFRYSASKSSVAAEVAVELTAEVPQPNGTLVLRNARVITSKGDEVIERGTVVIRNNRIVDVGATARVRVPPGAQVMNLEGKTIMPGLIDTHDHILGGSSIRIWPEQDRFLATALAYGVTTMRDPAASDLGAFYFAELVNTGQMRGPRAYTTGEHLLPPMVEVQNLSDAMHAVTLQKELGAIALKEYDQPTRRQRQLMAEAARRQNIMITAEGSIDFKNNLGMLIDGYTATEHLWSYHPLYADVGQLMAKTGFFYTPTIGTSAAGSEHWYHRMDVDHDPKQSHFLTHGAREHLWRRIIGQKIAPEWDPVYWTAVRSAARMLAAGAKLAVGSHDEPTPSGLGTHWELWSYVDGGMTPLQAIRCGTIGSADTLGMAQDLGTVEPGKLADLIVLDANPLQQIRNTIKIDRVIRNGFVYDGNTLDEVWPNHAKLPPLGGDE
jgi:imidazolonepropionase-like amidohydrolase/Tol biopolymer transport system component